MTTSTVSKPTILPDIFSLCTILSEATSYIDFGYNSNTSMQDILIQYDHDEDLDQEYIEFKDKNEQEEQSEEDEYEEDDNESNDNTDNENDEYSDSEISLHDTNIQTAISHLIQQANNQQTDLNTLMAQYEHLLRSEPESDIDSEQTEITSDTSTYFLQLDTKQDLFFLIATYTYKPNETYNQNYFNILKFYVLKYYNFQHLYIDDILYIIISFIASSLRFCSESNEFKYYNHKIEQVTFENNDSIIRFDGAYNDYLNIISDTCVLNKLDISAENEFNILINCFIMDKGDELWIGLIHRNDYEINKAIERRKGSLLYYGGREDLIDERYDKAGYSKWDNGFGAIHQTGEVKREKLPSYSKGDWVSFLISKKRYDECLLMVYKNGQLLYHTNKLPFRGNDVNDDSDMNEVYFVCTLDDEVDAVFMEQVVYNGRIPNFGKM
eukprot:266850_1